MDNHKSIWHRIVSSPHCDKERITFNGNWASESNLIAELSHYVQFVDDNYPLDFYGISDNIRVYSNPYNRVCARDIYDLNYNIEGAVENDAHGHIEPQLNKIINKFSAAQICKDKSQLKSIMQDIDLLGQDLIDWKRANKELLEDLWFIPYLEKDHPIRIHCNNFKSQYLQLISDLVKNSDKDSANFWNYLGKKWFFILSDSEKKQIALREEKYTKMELDRNND